MASGRINSDESIRTATQVVRAFGGSWAAVERASSIDSDGVHVIRRRDIPHLRANGAADRID